MIRILQAKGDMTRVQVVYNGVCMDTPVIHIEQARKVYQMLQGLPSVQAALVRLTTLRVYQVCNE